MYGLSTHIASLLVQRDCVIVPEFGAFLANPVSAKWNTVSHKFTPPRRQFSFNAKLSQNDGLLIHHFAEATGVDYETAKAQIATEVSEWEETLESDGSIALVGLGALTKQANATLRFEPEQQANNSLQSFGLHAFHRIPVLQEKTEQIADADDKKQDIPVIPPVRDKRSYWKYAAAALTLPLVGYTLYLTTQTSLVHGGDSFALADLNPFTEKVCPEYTHRKQTFLLDTLSIEKNVPSGNSLVLNDTEPALSIADVENRKSQKPVTNTAKPYHVIAGCFSDIDNAYKLVGKLNSAGYTGARILDQNKGLHRVTSGSFASEAEAGLVANDLRSSFVSGAWTLKK